MNESNQEERIAVRGIEGQLADEDSDASSSGPAGALSESDESDDQEAFDMLGPDFENFIESEESGYYSSDQLQEAMDRAFLDGFNDVLDRLEQEIDEMEGEEWIRNGGIGNQAMNDSFEFELPTDGHLRPLAHSPPQRFLWPSQSREAEGEASETSMQNIAEPALLFDDHKGKNNPAYKLRALREFTPEEIFPGYPSGFEYSDTEHRRHRSSHHERLSAGGLRSFSSGYRVRKRRPWRRPFRGYSYPFDQRTFPAVDPEITEADIDNLTERMLRMRLSSPELQFPRVMLPRVLPPQLPALPMPPPRRGVRRRRTRSSSGAPSPPKRAYQMMRNYPWNNDSVEEPMDISYIPCPPADRSAWRSPRRYFARSRSRLRFGGNSSTSRSERRDRSRSRGKGRNRSRSRSRRRSRSGSRRRNRRQRRSPLRTHRRARSYSQDTLRDVASGRIQRPPPRRKRRGSE